MDSVAPSMRWLALLAVVTSVGCRRQRINSELKNDGGSRAAVADESLRRAGAGDGGATAQRRARLADEACASYLRTRGIVRATNPSSEVTLTDPAANSWKRPETVRCALCGEPFRDGRRIVARIAIMNTAGAPADVYLQSTAHSPFWFETIPPAPPPPPSPTPLPEVYPAPLHWKIPAGQAFDTLVEADVASNVLDKGGSVRVRASVVFWNGGGFQPCGETTVSL